MHIELSNRLDYYPLVTPPFFSFRILFTLKYVYDHLNYFEKQNYQQWCMCDLSSKVSGRVTKALTDDERVKGLRRAVLSLGASAFDAADLKRSDRAGRRK